MSERRVPLGEICEFMYGRALREDRRAGGDVPVFGSNGVVGWHREAITSGATIVIGRKGSIGEVAWSEGPCYPIDTTYFVDKTKRPSELKWLYFALLRLDLTRFNKGTVPGLNRDDAYRQAVVFPSVSKQGQVARLLDKADRLRRTRHHMQRLGDSILAGVFVKLFGSGVGSHQVLTVEDLAEDRPGAIRTGPFGSQLLHSEFVTAGISVLGIDNAVTNRFAWSGRRFISPEKFEKLKRYKVYPGDVLITIMGTCGRSAVVPESVGLAINTKHLCCITVDRSLCLPTFLQGAFLYHPYVQRQLRAATKGAIMEGLNMEIIKGLKIPVPPPDEQQRYVDLVAQYERLRACQREGLRQAEDLFESLLNRYYGAEAA